MYKIMLADDEGIVLESLRFIIKKEFGDECIVESAKTGRAVIELAEQSRPDIAIMDIQMPGINGIEAIRQIKQRNPHIIFIIMTAYDRFSYAKEAINLGVFEFMNKPINRVEILQVLHQAMKQIDQERQQRSRELLIQEKLESITPVIENGLIYDILFQENFREDIENYKNILEITEEYGCMAVLICGDEQQGNHMTNAVGSSIRLRNQYPALRERVKESLHCIMGSTMGNKIALFLPYEKKQMDYQQRITLIEKARTLLRSLKQEYQSSFRLGIGPVGPLEELNMSYNKAIDALLYTDGSVVHADDVPLQVGYEENYPVETEKNLFIGIEHKDMNQVVLSTNQFFDWMESNYPNDLDDIRLKVIEFVLWAEHLAYLQGGGTYRFTSRRSYLSDVLGLQDMDSLRSWFLEKMTKACRMAQEQKEEHSDNIISRAQKYIEDHFSEKDISLDEVSRTVDISPYYFSKLFKEETGKTFIDYLTGIRIEKAKRLLASSSMSMKEICQAVGYADPNYFSRAFKKNVGVTPTEYKEIKR